MKMKSLFLTLTYLAVLGLCAADARAQLEITWLRTAADGPSTWNDDNNWIDPDGQNFAPSARFMDLPVIANGGTAFLDEPAQDNTDPFDLVEVGRDNQSGGLEVRGGGQLLVNSLRVGGGPDSSLVLSGDGRLTVEDDASTTRTTRIVGPNVNFTVGGAYTVDGLFQPIISGATHSAVQVGGAANVAGTLRPEFDGVTPQMGDSWTLIDAASINGNFGVVDTSLAPPLQPGVIYASAVDSNQGNLNLVVTNTLSLTVNRRTGQTSIANVVGDPIAFDSYSIDSPAGRLDPSDGAWLSLADSGNGGPGWTEGSANSQALSESKSSGTTEISVGSPVAIGAPYLAGNFAPEDLSFNYSLGGVTLPGVVTYEDVPYNLVLNVDPATGSAQLVNRATIPIEFDGYAVLSPGGGLQPGAGGWNSLEDSGAGGTGWAEANPRNTVLAELNPTSSTTLGPNESLDLGAIFNTASSQDLSFQFFLTGGSPDLRDGFVAYGLPVSLPGDCNGDGVVNAADLACVQTVEQRDAVLATIPSLPGDLDGNGQVAFPDFLTLSANFGQNVKDYTKGDIDLNGSVAFPDFLTLSSNFGKTPAAATAAVPEPSSWLLIGVAGLTLAAIGRRRNR